MESLAGVEVGLYTVENFSVLCFEVDGCVARGIVGGARGDEGGQAALSENSKGVEGKLGGSFGFALRCGGRLALGNGGLRA